MGVKSEWGVFCKFDDQSHSFGGLSLWILTLHDTQDHARREY